jgi:beta-lactamase superfamily II metal-dependent hydrolase
MQNQIRINFIGFLVLFPFSLFAQQLEIHHIDVGQADATLIKSLTNVTVLIDGGNSGNGTKRPLNASNTSDGDLICVLTVGNPRKVGGTSLNFHSIVLIECCIRTP